MRAFEFLTESKVLNEITRPPLIMAEYILFKAGYKRLDKNDAVFAQVYARPGADHVLKLFKSKDTAYMAFVDLVMKNKNIHFPVFKGRLIRVTNQYHAIQIERLTPAVEIPELGNPLTIGRTMENYMSAAPDEYREKQMNMIEKYQPGIKAACDLIADKLTPTYELDLHGQNIMMRGNVLVITDPVM